MGPEVGSLLSEARLRADGRCEVVIYDLEGVWSLSCMNEGGCTYHPDWGHRSLPGNRVTHALRGPRGERRRQAGHHAGRCCLSCPTGAHKHPDGRTGSRPVRDLPGVPLRGAGRAGAARPGTGGEEGRAGGPFLPAPTCAVTSAGPWGGRVRCDQNPGPPPHPLVLAPGLAGGAILGAPAPRHGMRPPHHHLSPSALSSFT